MSLSEREVHFLSDNSRHDFVLISCFKFSKYSLDIASMLERKQAAHVRNLLVKLNLLMQMGDLELFYTDVGMPLTDGSSAEPTQD